MTVSTAPTARVLPRHPIFAGLFMLAFLALLWLVELADRLVFTTPGDPAGLDDDGIIARHLDGLGGILWSPLLHGSWAHLEANSLPFLILGFLVFAGGAGQWFAVTAVVWLLGGALTWLTGSPGSTIGASGVIFGWLAFLLVRGFFARSGRQIVLAVVLLFVYGGVLWGVLPSTPGVSWQAHLFGGLAGVLAAWLTASADRRSPAAVAPSPPRPS